MVVCFFWLTSNFFCETSLAAFDFLLMFCGCVVPLIFSPSCSQVTGYLAEDDLTRSSSRFISCQRNVFLALVCLVFDSRCSCCCYCNGCCCWCNGCCCCCCCLPETFSLSHALCCFPSTKKTTKIQCNCFSCSCHHCCLVLLMFFVIIVVVGGAHAIVAFVVTVYITFHLKTLLTITLNSY